MYFDLEYVPTCNPLVDGDMMVTILLNLVRMGVRCAPSLDQDGSSPCAFVLTVFTYLSSQ